MRFSLAVLLSTLSLLAVNAQALDCAQTDINVEHKRLLGPEENICETYGGNVLLVVNVASMCGYTPQYAGLEKLYKDYKDKGLVLLGFPSGDFQGQELGSDEAIAKFCKLNYGVSFPMFTKSSVVGSKVNPLFSTLTARTGKKPTWNFNKYLVDRNGKVVAHFDTRVEPGSFQLKKAIETALAQSR
jgi:glutathione peroxidase